MRKELEPEAVCDQKMDKISQMMEDIILEAVIQALEKIRDRKEIFAAPPLYKCYREPCQLRLDFPF